VGPKAGLDVCEIYRPHRDSIPEQSGPYPVAIPTELPGPLNTWYSGEVKEAVEDPCKVLAGI
jgi:hypothetical protein